MWQLVNWFDCNWSIFKRKENTEAIQLSDITDKNKRLSPKNWKKNWKFKVLWWQKAGLNTIRTRKLIYFISQLGCYWALCCLLHFIIHLLCTLKQSMTILYLVRPTRFVFINGWSQTCFLKNCVGKKYQNFVFWVSFWHWKIWLQNFSEIRYFRIF